MTCFQRVPVYLPALALLLLVVVVGVTGSDVTQDKHQEASEGGNTPEPPQVTTPAGDILGSWMTSRRGRSFEAYRGIRYAEPPVGELRFQPPRPVLRHRGRADGSREGPACPQPADPAGGYLLDEDCLRLNVYTHTTKCARPRPVLVYIHAGGFYSASGRSDEAGPHYLLDYDLVFVALNYRLGSLGFLSTGDALAPGNNGLKDQVAALRWVRRNIAAFCGDPQLVTVAGYSAGAISVALHMVSPMSRGLFHRARAMSGSPFTQTVTPNHQYHLAVRQARASGCPDHNSSVILDCLRKVPWRDLGNSLDSMFEYGYDPILVWLPVIEADFGQERFLTEDPVLSVRQGRMHAVPLMISQTRDEFFWKAYNVLANESLFTAMANDWERTAAVAFQLPRGPGEGRPAARAPAARALRRAYLGERALLNDTRTAAGLGRLYGDSVIGFPVHRMAELMAAHSSRPVFYYLFNYTGRHSFYEDPVTKRPTGAAHHDDLIYLLSLRRVFPDVRADGGRDARLLDTMCRIMYHFAEHGSPRCAGCPRWPPLAPPALAYLSLGAQHHVGENLFEERFRVWEDLFPLS